MTVKKTGFNMGFALVAVIGVLFLHNLIVRSSQVSEIPYDEFLKYLRDGMDEVVGQVSHDGEPAGFLDAGGNLVKARNHSESTAREIDRAVRDLVERAYGRALEILRSNRAVLEEGARTLLARETLPKNELAEFFRRTAPDSVAA